MSTLSPGALPISALPWLVAAWLFAVGLYGIVTSRHCVHLVGCLTVCQSATYVLLLGLGPVGAAFYLWDIGCKRGDVRVLGVAAYAAPVLSTLILVATGYAAPSPALAAACLLIVAGALLAVRASRRA